MKKINIYIIFYLFAQIVILAQSNEDFVWPREFEKDNVTITIYQPQVESFEKNILEGRMAISVKPQDKDLIFCAAWFKAIISTDLEARTATLEHIEIPQIHFPDLEDQSKIDEFSKLLETEIESWDIEMSLDRLSASLSDVEDLSTKSATLNNDPPDIYFRTTQSLLVSIDGDPVIKKIENTELEYVVNTAFFIVRENEKSTFYIKGGKFWYESNEITGNWKSTKNVPNSIVKLAEENIDDTEPDSISTNITNPPELVVVTKPSELIQTDGDPDYQSIDNTTLLYIKNTESDIIMDINSQKHFVLLAGRWYQSKTLKDGNWKFTEPSDLPEDFSKIPDSSDMGNVRSNIPGTPEAQDALLEQTIPQTAAVDRASTTLVVYYDGDPEFKLVDGTNVYYAVNTDKQVLRINDRFYCVDDAIWFVSANATGPWDVCDTRPKEVDEIPPSSEVYNVKYVYIYDSTPDIVYVGYYPGYTHCYVYGGVVVYGTGYWYRPWYGYYYYPRPVTWGFGVHWNPWTGWGFSYGFSYGWIGWHFHPYRGWWGPRGYHYGYRHGYYHGYHHGYRHGARAGFRAGYYAGRRNTYNNVYKNRQSSVNSSTRQRVRTGKVSADRVRPSTKPNNLYADKNGNIHQRNRDGNWTQKSNSKVKQPSTRESQEKLKTNKTVRNKGQEQLNRSYTNRNRGTNNYNKARSSYNNTRGAIPNRSRRR